MNRQEILIRKRNCIGIKADAARTPRNDDARVSMLQVEVMRLGYMLGEDVALAASTLSSVQFARLKDDVLNALTHLTGNDVTWKPFYSNFPQQVVEASDLELYFNAIVHYWSCGTWAPTYEKVARIPDFENVTFQFLNLADDKDMLVIFSEILSSNASVTEVDRKIMLEMMDKIRVAMLESAIPENIPFKENLCWFVAECIKRKWHVVGMSALKNATDVLRVATHLSGGDVSLAENTRFKSFSRPVRRAMVNRLESIINADDVFRHRGKWVRLAHSLHVGDYAQNNPKTYAILGKARDNKSKHKTFDSRVEAALQANDSKALTELLSQRPGVFARRLDHAIRTVGTDVIDPFGEVASDVDTRVLLQLYGHFKGRTKEVNRRVVFPKGGTAKSHLLTNTLKPLSKKAVNDIQHDIVSTLHDRFVELDKMGSVYIDPALKDCPIPLSLRSASEGMKVVARGTKMPLTAGNDTLRMFIYWKGQDIDLSAFFVNEKFTKQEAITYYDLKNNFAHHSGDITSAPNGACEFIDIDMKKAVAMGYRYVVMSVLVYSGPNFNEHKECYAGWMTRSKPNSNEIFDAKTVEQRVDLQSASKKAIPVIFDMVERKAIWLDLSTGRGYDNIVRPNNVATNAPSLYDGVTSALNLNNKPTLYDLFEMHANARGQWLVADPEEADIKFGWDGDVTPYDTTKILSEYL